MCICSTKKGSRRLAIIFLIPIPGVMSGIWGDSHSIRALRQKKLSVDFFFNPVLILHVSIWRSMSKECLSVAKQPS